MRPELPARPSAQDRFVDAAGRGDFGEVDRRLLAEDVAVDATNAQGTTALLAAIDSGELAMVKRLLDAGASAERAAAGRTPLVASADAAVSGSAIAVSLLEAGATANRHDAAGRLALVEHARRGHGAAVVALLSAGAEVERADVAGSTALAAAAQVGHVAVVERLLAAGASVDTLDRTGASPLFHAAAAGHTAVVAQLLEAEAKADLQDMNGRAPLGAALAGGHHAVARTLLQTGLAPDAPVWPPEGRGMVVVAARGDVKGAVLLHTSGAWLDAASEGVTPLMAAATNGRVAMVRWLLSRGASTTASDVANQTALHRAAATGQATIVKLLVDAGADPRARDADGQRPVDIARTAGHARVVRIFDR